MKVDIILSDAKWHSFEVSKKIMPADEADAKGLCKNCKFAYLPHPQDENRNKICTLEFLKEVKEVKYNPNNRLGFELCVTPPAITQTGATPNNGTGRFCRVGGKIEVTLTINFEAELPVSWDFLKGQSREELELSLIHI